WGWTVRCDRHPTGADPSPTHVGMDRPDVLGECGHAPEPHARGDGPPRRSRRMRTRSRAPRTWGWTGRSDVGDVWVVQRLTHVGMDRPDVRAECGRAPEHHARGDGPVGQTSATYGPSRAPRTWGWTDHPVLHRHRQAPSPTHAGDEVFLRLYAQSSRGVRLLVSADFCDSSENVRGRPYGSASETYIAPRRLAMSMDAPHGHGGSPESLDMGLWGKSEGLPPDVRYPLICHLLDVGAVAEVLWRDHVAIGVRQTIADGLETTVEHAGRLIPYWASLHDVGKLNHGFQAQDVAAPIHRYPGSELRRSHGQVVG